MPVALEPAVEPVVEPVVDPVLLPIAEPEPVRALVSTNAAPLDAFEPVDVADPAVVDVPLPEVPTAPPIWLPCCRHPLMVIVSALLLVPVRLDCDPVVDELPLVVWAAAPPLRASARAATLPIHTFRIMLPPSSSRVAAVQHSFHREMFGKACGSPRACTAHWVDRYHPRPHS
ncbi:MAG TPA: hypothetical protein VFA27_00160 [Vicinamibacterales bacterium]|nr:hypothetical protein [Vicinamibacterales bacterium]